jgi:uncharacterized protein YecE (DUF72 family)
VVFQCPASFRPEPENTAAGPAYLRLHGTTGARHVYAELDRLLAMTPAGAYVLFNNIPRVNDAQRFQALVSGS